MKHEYILIFFIFSLSFTMEKDEKQKSAWTRKYHTTSLRQFQFAQAQLPALDLKETEDVLDLGCGTGRITHLIAQYLPNGSIVGIDSSEDMIEFAQREYGDAKNLQFQVADAQKLEFNGTFDRVISFFCLQWLKKKQEGMNGIMRALKSGGRCHIFVPVVTQDSKTGHQHIFAAVLERHQEWKAFCTIPNREKVETWIERAQESGLRVASQKIISNTLRYANKKEAIEYTLNLGLTTLPEKEKEQFISEVYDLFYNQHGLSDDDPYVGTTNILGLELTKN